MLERVTFILAVIGYAGLAATAIRSARARLPVGLWRAAVSIILAHVLLVWMARYEWQFAEATRNGYPGFLVFHGALAMILASVFVGERAARALVLTAFVVVTFGAVGAVFRYDAVAAYRIPVMLIALAGAAGLIRRATSP
jgi:hypothetical protein